MGKFNTYIEHPEIERWRDLCVNEGELCRYNKGEEFVSVGRVARYIGYVKSGTLKYVAYDDNGSEHIVGLEFAGEFVADFPFSLRGEPSRVAIVADSNCEIYRYPRGEITCKISPEYQCVISLVLLSPTIAPKTACIVFRDSAFKISLFAVLPIRNLVAFKPLLVQVQR